MKRLALSLLLFSMPEWAGAFPGDFSGELGVEYRYFPGEGAYGNRDRHVGSLFMQAEYSMSWDDDRKVVSFAPYARLDGVDDERSHFDIRELSLVASWPYLELRAGISKVFWGVTESQHLVDVINQTDYVENPDGEQKLGQPMINPVLVTPTGNLEFFVLPWFRERTLPGEDGRYRGALPVDTDKAEYTHEKENRHIDYALRWSATTGDLEWALSYFKGTDREPGFRPGARTGSLIPIYGQSRQAGLELQYIYKDLLAKAELLRKDSELHSDYRAATVGFEYTFANVANGKDIGLLYEWLYDSRGRDAPSGMYDASFVGTRLAFNDEASTEMLIGAIFSNDNTALNLFRVEASSRIGESLSLELELNIVGRPPANSVLWQFRRDDYMQLSLSTFF